ncbi:MAG: Tol-Pal system beta propeller repeat protein TolB [Lysobacterales bacterium]
MRKQWLAVVLTVLALAVLTPAQSQDDVVIVITPSGESAVPIAVVPFAWNAETPMGEADVTKVVTEDLSRSGQFRTLPMQDMIERPSRISDVNYGTWRRLNVDYIVIGEVTGSDTLGYRIRMHLLNVTTGDSLLSLEFTARAGGLRYTSHHIADTVYEKLLDVPGFFRTRLVYVTRSGEGDNTEFSLMVADADGHGPQPVVRSKEPLLSPTWAPDGQTVAYVSFEKGNSSIYTQELASGQRQLVSSFKGINGAPAFSPDGRKLALALSRSGNLEIYVMDLATRRTVQLTRHFGIDTEPAWSQDGKSVFFTSDRGGRPQIYQVAARSGAEPERVTRQGEYNARASMSPDGSQLVLVHGNDNNYKIALLDTERNLLRTISDGPLDESPSFAPNGRMVLYASRRGSQGVLSAVPIFGAAAAGQTAHQLLFADGDIREPAWSPIRQ